MNFFVIPEVYKNDKVSEIEAEWQKLWEQFLQGNK